MQCGSSAATSGVEGCCLENWAGGRARTVSVPKDEIFLGGRARSPMTLGEKKGGMGRARREFEGLLAAPPETLLALVRLSLGWVCPRPLCQSRVAGRFVVSLVGARRKFDGGAGLDGIGACGGLLLAWQPVSPRPRLGTERLA